MHLYRILEIYCEIKNLEGIESFKREENEVQIAQKMVIAGEI